MWPRTAVRGSAASVWSRLLGPEGFVREGRIDGLLEGDRYRVKAATGEVFEGTVVVNHAPFEFAGTLSSLNDALVCLRSFDAGGPQPKDGHVASIWLSTWGVPASEAEGFRDRWQRWLDGLFPAPGGRTPQGVAL